LRAFVLPLSTLASRLLDDTLFFIENAVYCLGVLVVHANLLGGFSYGNPSPD